MASLDAKGEGKVTCATCAGSQHDFRLFSIESVSQGAAQAGNSIGIAAARTGAKLRLCSLQGPKRSSASRCSGVG
jgi:hypothetical protein